jgi:DNA-binding XRE family transcriptional regulator
MQQEVEVTETEQYIQDRVKRDPEFKAAWEAGEPAFRLRQALIAARIAAGLTQAELAERLASHQSAIARIEAGRVNPSFDILMRYAKALGVRFEVSADQVEVRPAA